MRSAIIAVYVLAIGAQACPMIARAQTQDFYPAKSRRLHEEGTTRVKVCVDEKGNLTSEPVVTLSSGYPRLDEASIRLAKAGSGRYKPATQDGKTVAACAEFNIAWKLK
jgi:TonB family protein